MTCASNGPYSPTSPRTRRMRPSSVHRLKCTRALRPSEPPGFGHPNRTPPGTKEDSHHALAVPKILVPHSLLRGDHIRSAVQQQHRGVERLGESAQLGKHVLGTHRMSHTQQHSTCSGGKHGLHLHDAVGAMTVALAAPLAYRRGEHVEQPSVRGVHHRCGGGRFLRPRARHPPPLGARPRAIWSSNIIRP